MPTDPKDIDPIEKYRKCDGCLKPRADLDAPLLQCSACRMAAYCSKECQRSDWKSHKPRCKVNQEHAAALKETPFMPGMNIPDGITLPQYDERLEEWISVWSFTMCEAAIHAMRVPQDQKRCRTHILHVTLKGRTQKEHKGNSKFYFEVVSAVARPIVEARKRIGAWREGIDAMEDRRRQIDAMGGQDMILVVVEAPPLGAQFVPIGSIPRLNTVKIQDDWEETLKYRVKKGQTVQTLGRW